MNCDEVRELLAAYALDALTEEERAAVREHLQDCALHPELVALRSAAEALAGTAEPAAPPPELRARVLALASPPVASEHARVTPFPARSPWASFVPWAVAAVFAVIAFALGARTLQAPPAAPVLVHREGTATTGPAHARLTYAADTQLVVFEVDAVAPPPAGSEYQLWVVRGNTPVSLGVFSTTAEGHASVAARSALAAGEVIAVTLEPAGGSPAPTTQPFLAITF